jgi:hypothetical protein
MLITADYLPRSHNITAHIRVIQPCQQRPLALGNRTFNIEPQIKRIGGRSGFVALRLKFSLQQDPS